MSPDYNQSMEQQRGVTMKRIEYLRERGVFDGFLTGRGPEAEMRKFALFDAFAVYDHSLAIKLGVHFYLWYANSYLPSLLLRVYFSLLLVFSFQMMILFGRNCEYRQHGLVIFAVSLSAITSR